MVLAMPDGKIEVARESIQKIVPGFWPETEWETRRQQAHAAGFDARFAAVWWAIENGLTAEVAAELRELHALDPKHLPRRPEWPPCWERLDRPCIDPDFLTDFRRHWGSRPRWRAGRT